MSTDGSPGADGPGGLATLAWGRWNSLDRGWRATILGLVVVGVHLLWALP